jgi:hypothetical protein
MNNMTEAEIEYLQLKGISKSEIDRQERMIKEGVESWVLNSACTIGNGVEELSDDDLEQFNEVVDKRLEEGLRVCKMVPASGAASRMFKLLSDVVSGKLDLKSQSSWVEFYSNIEKFAFAPKVISKWGELPYSVEKWTEVAIWLLSKKGLDFSESPKAVIDFHCYDKGVRTPVAEHYFESQALNCGIQRIHFTASEEHADLFEIEKNKLNDALSMDLSFQSESTHSLALSEQGEWLKKEDGKVLLRPSGHGALLDNLSNIDEEFVMLRNIDNVQTTNVWKKTIPWRRALLGKLISVKQEIDILLIQIEKAQENSLSELSIVASQLLSKEFDVNTLDELKNELNRPLRVCGVVLNTGEPGGGPFWVELEENGKKAVRRQIVESAQVSSDKDQQTLFSQGTHFNPVELFLALKDYKGEDFELSSYVDEKSGFVVNKSYLGKPLTAMERPGLWNGAMAFWNTLFVEIPSELFSPVKSMNDLLKQEHQVEN